MGDVPQKKKTTAQQFEVLVQEMEKNPTLAKGIPIFGGSKAEVNQSWDKIAQKLNGLGPPVRSASDWRKVWTDFRGRTKKKIANNVSSLRRTGGGPYSGSDLSALEQAVDNVMHTSTSANPKGAVFGLPKASNLNENQYLNEEGSSTSLSYDQFEVEFLDVDPLQSDMIADSPSKSKSPVLNKNTPGNQKQSMNIGSTRKRHKTDGRTEMMELMKLQNKTLEKRNECIEANTKALLALINLIEVLNRKIN